MKRIPTFALLVLSVFLMMVLSILWPKQSYSEAENKYLSTLPSISLSALEKGTFMSKYETYLSDQLPGRGSWIRAKAFAESLLLKTENNDILYGKNDYLFPKFQHYDTEVYDANLEAIEFFTKNSVSPVHLMVVPSSYTVLSTYLPDSVPMVDEEEAMKRIAQLAPSVNVIDVLPTLRAHGEDYVYYRTDHHWTSYGAWLAYADYCSAIGTQPAWAYEEQTGQTVENFLGTSYSKCKKANVLADTITYFPTSAFLTVDDNTYDTLYDFSKTQTRDKYAMFLFGNHAQSVVESSPNPTKKQSLLLIKDSYADCMVPYLTDQYETITCVDPRYYLDNFQELAAIPYDDVLLLVGFENLSSEVTWCKLGF